MGLSQTVGHLRRAIAATAGRSLDVFAEPASLAVRGTLERDSRYRQAAFLLLGRAAQEAGVYPAFATHDHRLIEEIITQARAHDRPRDRYDFERLYGVRPELHRDLARRGHRIRVYLRFGTDWFPYAIRRVGESPPRPALRHIHAH